MSNTSSFFGRHGSVLIASVLSPLQTVWDLSHCANHHASHVWVFVHIFMCANKRRKGRRNREVRLCFIYGGERAWCDLMSGSSMGHWTWKIKRQRWPWLEVSLTDYFMSVFKCAHTCACWWLVCSWTGVYRQSESHAVYHLQCQVRDCWFWFVKPEAASHPQTECGYTCVCEVLASADASETEKSDLRHVPRAKVKGHCIQTHPEKLSVRKRQGLWDHLTNTLTHNIMYATQHPVGFSSLLSSQFSLSSWWPGFLLCEHIIHSDNHQQNMS